MIVFSNCLPLIELPLLLLDEVHYQFLFVNVVFVGVVQHRLLHDKHALVVAVLYKLIFDVFEHHVESILYIIFRASGHQFYNL